MVAARRSQHREGHGLKSHSLLHEAVEEFASVPGCPTIESEGELIKVVIQLLSRYGPLMGTQQPPLQKRRHPVHPREEHRGRLSAPADHPGLVRVPLGLQPLVALPSVRDYHGSRLDSALHERDEAWGGSIRNPAQANASDALPIDLRGDPHQGLVSQVSSAPSALHSTHVRFVHLDFAGEPIPTGPHHSAPQLLQAGPSRLVTPQAQQTLQAQGADPMLLIGDPPHSPEPSSKREMTSMEDRPGRYRRLVSAFAAFHQASGHRPVLTALASRAPKARRPAQLNQVGAAIRLRSKSPLEFGQRARIVLHAPYHYIWGLVESSEYPSHGKIVLVELLNSREERDDVK